MRVVLERTWKPFGRSSISMPPSVPKSLRDRLFTESEVRFESRSVFGWGAGKIRSALGADATMKLGSGDGREVWAEGKSEGMVEPRVVLQVEGRDWLEIQCDVEESAVGRVKVVGMDRWRVVNSETGAVLAVCNFRTFRDQLLELYDWFSSLVKDEAGQTVGKLKGVIRFPRLIPVLAVFAEKRFRIYRGGRLLAVVARAPMVLQRYNPIRFKLIPHRLQIRFEEGISGDDRMFVYGVCLVTARTPV